MNYDHITDEMFDSKLAEILDHMSGEEILLIPGVYEEVREFFNNQVLGELTEPEED